MAAYMIITAEVTDPARFRDDYGRPAAALMARYGGRYLLEAPRAELLEGDFGDAASMIISEWPDKKTARLFWDSPEFTKLRKRQEKLATCQVLLIESPFMNPV